MRWSNPEPKLGDTRNNTVFAWYPRRNLEDTYWLEKVRLYQVYSAFTDGRGLPSASQWVTTHMNGVALAIEASEAERNDAEDRTIAAKNRDSNGAVIV